MDAKMLRSLTHILFAAYSAYINNNFVLVRYGDGASLVGNTADLSQRTKVSEAKQRSRYSRSTRTIATQWSFFNNKSSQNRTVLQDCIPSNVALLLTYIVCRLSDTMSRPQKAFNMLSYGDLKYNTRTVTNIIWYRQKMTVYQTETFGQVQIQRNILTNYMQWKVQLALFVIGLNSIALQRI